MCWCHFLLSHLSTLHPSFCADVSRGQMFIAIIKQPLLWSCVLSVPFCSPFILCWAEGIGAARLLCGSVIRKGGRESASQQDSLFYIHQKSCLWFAPSLTCDSMDCSTILLLRKSCTYHPLFHTSLTPPSFLPSLFPAILQPCPQPADYSPPLFPHHLHLL